MIYLIELLLKDEQSLGPHFLESDEVIFSRTCAKKVIPPPYVSFLQFLFLIFQKLFKMLVARGKLNIYDTKINLNF